jgi:hypothetical protein
MFGKYNGFVSKARVSACMYFLVGRGIAICEGYVDLLVCTTFQDSLVTTPNFTVAEFPNTLKLRLYDKIKQRL